MKQYVVTLDDLKNDRKRVVRLARSKRPRLTVVDKDGRVCFRLWIPSEPLR